MAFATLVRRIGASFGNRTIGVQAENGGTRVGFASTDPGFPPARQTVRGRLPDTDVVDYDAKARRVVRALARASLKTPRTEH